MFFLFFFLFKMSNQKERINNYHLTNDIFLYNDKKYKIDNSQFVDCIGDLDENTSIILIDNRVPKKFFSGIAFHEIEERKLILLGHSYTFSHNEAQKKELQFYQQLFGEEAGKRMLEEEERIVLKIFMEESRKCLKILKNNPPENNILIKETNSNLLY